MPSGITLANAVTGSRRQGRRSQAVTSAGLGSRGGRRKDSGPMGGNSGRSRRARAMPGGLDRGSAPTAMVDRSDAGTPCRSRAPTTDPAEVPTTMSAVRGSQPRSCSIAARAAVWYAMPITPPPPITSPTRTAPWWRMGACG